jgi:hypothetical protein
VGVDCSGHQQVHVLEQVAKPGRET